MKLKTLAAAIATVGAIAAAQHAAAALNPQSPVDLTLFVSGATALDTQFVKYASLLCDADPTDPAIFLTNQTSSGAPKIPGNAQTAFICKVSPSKIPGLAATRTVAVYKRSSGGSGWGVGPVSGAPGPDGILFTSDDVKISRMDRSTCDTTADGTFTPFAGGTVYQAFVCTATIEDTPIAGISDVEPAMFSGPNLIDASIPENADVLPGDPGTVALSTDQLAALDVYAMNATTFGIVVTTKLRNALQAAQGLVVGSDTVANMPSLPKELVASIMSGKVPTWDKIHVNYAGADYTLNTHPLVAGTANAPNSTKVEICRRSPGSGTQAQYNALFQNAPCNSGASAPMRDNTTRTSRVAGSTYGTAVHDNIGLAIGRAGVSSTAPAVHEGQGSGDVEVCISKLNTNAGWGIGINSLERGHNDMRFVRLDGIAPTLENVAKNNYFDWAGATMQYLKNPTSKGMSAEQLAILEAIRDESSDPVILDSINDNFNPRITDGKVGILALTPRYAVQSPFNVDYPVMSISRDVGGAPNTCATGVVVTGGTATGIVELDTNVTN